MFTMQAVRTSRMEFRLDELRWAGAAMLGIAALWPTSHPGFGLPCPLRTITGVPCPFCGMTTSVVALVHGHPLTAAAANPFGFVAVAVAVYLLLVRSAHQWAIPTAVLAPAVVGSWLFQLHRWGFL